MMGQFGQTSDATDGSRHQWVGFTLAIGAIVLSGLAMIPTGVTGVATVTRFVLGTVGIAGGVLFLMRKPAWKPLLIGWSAAQIPFVVVDASGSLFHQTIWIGINTVQTRSINGQIVSASGFGINFWGVLLLVLTLLVIKKRWHPPQVR